MIVTDTDLRRRMNATTRMNSTVFVGVDLGKRENPSAIVVLERFEVMPEYTDVLRGAGLSRRYVVRQAERLALGTPYTEVVKRVKQVVTAVMARMPSSSCNLVVDESGPGVPVVEMMRAAGMGCAICGYTITNGAAATGSSVPRAEIVTRVQLMLEQEELEIAEGCRDAAAIEREMTYLQLSGKASGENDDIAMGLALVCWKARVR